MTAGKPWLEQEESHFKAAWMSGAYDKPDLARIFQRSWMALTKKAKQMNLPTWTEISSRVRLEAIEKTLREDNII